MSNVFQWPSEAETNYINPADPLYVGTLSRANTFLNGGNDVNTPYAKPYHSDVTRMSGLSPRTPEKMLETASRFRTYYGVATGQGKGGYPTFQSIWENPMIECYFHVIKFRFSSQIEYSPLKLRCVRDSSSHTNVYMPTTTSHGMGNASVKYTDSYSRRFTMHDFADDPLVPSGWSSLNNNNYYVKVIDHQDIELYTDEALTIPVDSTSWGLFQNAGYAVITSGQGGSYQMIWTNLVDKGNRPQYHYVKDHYSGANAEVNGQFGANIVGARPGWFVSSSLTSTSTFYSNPPIDYLSLGGDFRASAFIPGLTIQCLGDGDVYNGSNGYVNGITFNPYFGGLMEGGGTYSSPSASYAYCANLVYDQDSDAQAGYNFSISNISKASPCVVTFTNSIYSQTTSAVKTITGIPVGGVTELNGDVVYCKSISHNQVALYTNSALTTPLNTTGLLGTASITSGATLQDFDNNIFDSSSVFGGNYFGRTYDSSTNFGPMPLDFDVASSTDQQWPDAVKPTKIDMRLIQPTRKTYGQDLTRYTNSTGAFGYRMTITYNNISKSDWKIYDSFIKQMRGASAPFIFFFSENKVGYDIFESDSDTVSDWNTNTVKLAKQLNPGDSSAYFFGFDPNTTVCKNGDILYSFHSYRSTFSYNNVGFVAGDFGSNEFGEAIIRLTHPAKNSLSPGSSNISPAATWDFFSCMLTNDEIEFQWHPTGNFVSFTVDMDLV